jgi:hypothetical protein
MNKKDYRKLLADLAQELIDVNDILRPASTYGTRSLRAKSEAMFMIKRIWQRMDHVRISGEDDPDWRPIGFELKKKAKGRKKK